ncbi:50S ribosomal protein L25 [Desulfoscipio sp. XC116]|uniref:50S ribosomal protein L25 n=1 Tax=Desulfoscipio sp. XC116 TaxID=3144975 RepID=UPI00325BB001
MANLNLQVSYRQQKGKSYRKQLARREMIPGVVYGKAVGSIPIEVELKPLKKILSAGANSLIDLSVKGPETEERHCKVLIKSMQYGAVKHNLLSVDLHQISLESTIQTAVPINFSGAVNDGLVQYALREIQVSCLPTDIPREVNVNIDGLTIGDTIAVRDVAIPNNVDLVDDPGTTVVTVVAQRADEAPAVEAAPGEDEPGAAADGTPA